MQWTVLGWSRVLTGRRRRSIVCASCVSCRFALAFAVAQATMEMAVHNGFPGSDEAIGVEVSGW